MGGWVSGWVSVFFEIDLRWVGGWVGGWVGWVIGVCVVVGGWDVPACDVGIVVVGIADEVGEEGGGGLDGLFDLSGWVGGWVGGWMSCLIVDRKVEENEEARGWVGGWVGGWVVYLGVGRRRTVGRPRRKEGIGYVTEQVVAGGRGGWVGGWVEEEGGG